MNDIDPMPESHPSMEDASSLPLSRPRRQYRRFLDEKAARTALEQALRLDPKFEGSAEALRVLAKTKG